MLEFDLECSSFFHEDIVTFVTIERKLERCTRPGGIGMLPGGMQVTSRQGSLRINILRSGRGDGREECAGNAFLACVNVALKGQRVFGRQAAVRAKSSPQRVPPVPSLRPPGAGQMILIEVFAKDPVVRALSQ